MGFPEGYAGPSTALGREHHPGHGRSVGRKRGYKARRATRGAVGKGRVQSCAGQARSRHSPPADEITSQPNFTVRLAVPCNIVSTLQVQQDLYAPVRTWRCASRRRRNTVAQMFTFRRPSSCEETRSRAYFFFGPIHRGSRLVTCENTHVSPIARSTSAILLEIDDTYSTPTSISRRTLG